MPTIAQLRHGELGEIVLLLVCHLYTRLSRLTLICQADTQVLHLCQQLHQHFDRERMVVAGKSTVGEALRQRYGPEPAPVADEHVTQVPIATLKKNRHPLAGQRVKTVCYNQRVKIIAVRIRSMPVPSGCLGV